MTSRIANAFGWYFALGMISIYAFSQGVGQQLLNTSLQYYALDTLSLASEEWNRLKSFTNLPWQLKPIIGYVSDVQLLPCGGYRRNPFLIAGALLGMLSAGALYGLAGTAVIPGVGIVLVLGLTLRLGAALIDVMMDALLAEHAGKRPDLTADMQGLQMTSIAILYVIVPLLTGSVLQKDGTQPLFAYSFAAFLWVIIPAACRWVEETARPSTAEDGLATSASCRSLCDTDTKVRAAKAAVLTSSWALIIGVLNITYGAEHAFTIGAVSEVGNFVLCLLLYFLLRPLDEYIPRVAIFCYLFNSLYPQSTALFEWQHAPSAKLANDLRCKTEQECLVLDPSIEDVNGLPCGWASSRGMPCLSPTSMATLDAMGALFFVLATGFYTSLLQGVSYRTMLTATFAGRVLASVFDYLLVTRYNLVLGISDFSWLLMYRFFVATNFRLLMMPLFTLFTQLCPPGFEGTIFALLMGLENSGDASGHYLGSQVLNLLGGVRKPDFENIEMFPIVQGWLTLLTMALIPFLIPHGRPSDSLRMGSVRKTGQHHDSDVVLM